MNKNHADFKANLKVTGRGNLEETLLLESGDIILLGSGSEQEERYFQPDGKGNKTPVFSYHPGLSYQEMDEELIQEFHHGRYVIMPVPNPSLRRAAIYPLESGNGLKPYQVESEIVICVTEEGIFPKRHIAANHSWVDESLEEVPIYGGIGGDWRNAHREVNLISFGEGMASELELSVEDHEHDVKVPVEEFHWEEFEVKYGRIESIKPPSHTDDRFFGDWTISTDMHRVHITGNPREVMCAMNQYIKQGREETGPGKKGKILAKAEKECDYISNRRF